MTFLVFMMGVSLVLNGAVGWIAWQVVQSSAAERAAHERTRLECAKMVRELERIKQLAKPMQVVTPEQRKPMSMQVIIGAALAKYEREAAMTQAVAEAIHAVEVAA